MREREGAHLDPDDATTRLAQLSTERPELDLGPRLERLAGALAGEAQRSAYLDRYGCAGVRRFAVRGDVTIYLMPAETFPHHINNVYLLMEPGHTLLFDVGSGSPTSRRDLDLGFAVVRAAFGVDARYEGVDTAIVSHAHIDHFGGVGDLRLRTGRGSACTSWTRACCRVSRSGCAIPRPGGAGRTLDLLSSAIWAESRTSISRQPRP